jgi:hypothetical protein
MTIRKREKSLKNANFTQRQHIKIMFLYFILSYRNGCNISYFIYFLSVLLLLQNWNDITEEPFFGELQMITSRLQEDKLAIGIHLLQSKFILQFEKLSNLKL